MAKEGVRHLGRDRTHGFFSLASPMSGGNAESVSCSQEEKSHLKDITKGGCQNRGTAVSSRRIFSPFLPAVSSRRFFPTYIFPPYLPAVSSRDRMRHQREEEKANPPPKVAQYVYICQVGAAGKNKSARRGGG